MRNRNSANSVLLFGSKFLFWSMAAALAFYVVWAMTNDVVIAVIVDLLLAPLAWFWLFGGEHPVHGPSNAVREVAPTLSIVDDAPAERLRLKPARGGAGRGEATARPDNWWLNAYLRLGVWLFGAPWLASKSAWSGVRALDFNADTGVFMSGLAPAGRTIASLTIKLSDIESVLVETEGEHAGQLEIHGHLHYRHKAGARRCWFRFCVTDLDLHREVEDLAIAMGHVLRFAYYRCEPTVGGGIRLELLATADAQAQNYRELAGAERARLLPLRNAPMLYATQGPGADKEETD